MFRWPGWSRRKRRKGSGAAGALLFASLIGACSASAEQPLLDRFFSASRLRDRTALANIATVVFEPLQQGIVTRFQIVRVTPQPDGTKTVVLDAPVKLPDGAIAAKTLSVTIERRGGRWMVTAFHM